MNTSLVFATSGLALTLFSTLFLLAKKPRQAGDAEAVALLWFLALPSVLTQALPLLMARPGRLLFLRAIIPLGFPPALFLFARRIIFGKQRPRRALALHALPLVIATAMLFSPLVTMELARTSDSNAASRLVQTTLGTRPNPSRLPPVERAMVRPAFVGAAQVATTISVILYAIPTWTLLRRHRSRAREFFSFSSSSVNLAWLGALLIAFVAIHAYLLAALLLSLSGVRSPILNPALSIDVGYTLFLFCFAFFALQQERFFFRFSYQDSVRAESLAGDDVREKDRGHKYLKSSISDDRTERIFQKIEELMSRRRLFRDSDLTLGSLSDKTGIPRHYISQTINKKTGGNFYSYVNAYRISDAIAAIDDSAGERRDDSLLSIALASGFNSKSSFNEYFKERTGLTPRQYREKRASETQAKHSPFS